MSQETLEWLNQNVLIGFTDNRLRDVDSPGPSLGRAVAEHRWLFPGRHPGTHRDGKQLTRVLTHTHGIDVRRSRNTALLALAERLPAAVLADLLGLHPHTAAGWTRLAKRDWIDYVGERSRQPRSTRPPGARTI